MLLTNGDSFTYGDELPGSRPESGVEPTHQGLTYTHHLASHLGCNYVNLAQNGSSNIKIYRRTMDFLQKTSKKVEYAVILWSSWGRLEVCEPTTYGEDERLYIGRETDMNQLIPANKSGSFLFPESYEFKGHEERNRIYKDWIENLYTMETAIVHSLTYMKNIQFICDLMNIKLIQGIIHPAMWTNILFTFDRAESDENLVDYRKFVSESMNYLRPECKLGLGDRNSITQFCEDNGHRILGGGHPDHLGHKAYGDFLFGVMKEKFEVN